MSPATNVYVKGDPWVLYWRGRQLLNCRCRRVRWPSYAGTRGVAPKTDHIRSVPGGAAFLRVRQSVVRNSRNTDDVPDGVGDTKMLTLASSRTPPRFEPRDCFNCIDGSKPPAFCKRCQGCIDNDDRPNWMPQNAAELEYLSWYPMRVVDGVRTLPQDQSENTK